MERGRPTSAVHKKPATGEPMTRCDLMVAATLYLEPGLFVIG
jgi:hypothetical protein